MRQKTAAVDAHKKIPGRATTVLSRKYEDIASRLPLAEMVTRWRCGLRIKNLKAHYNTLFFVSFNFCFEQELLICL